MREPAKLETLITALDASPRSLRRDSCGDWTIRGRQGHIYADGKGFLIVVATGRTKGYARESDSDATRQ